MAETLKEMITDMREKIDKNLYAKPSDMVSDYKKINDLISYKVIKEDIFFGTILSQVSKSISVDVPAPAAVNIKRAGFMLYVNPFSILTFTDFKTPEEASEYRQRYNIPEDEPLCINKNLDIDTLIKNIVAVYIHEVYHLIMLHLIRRIPLIDNHDPKLMNIAMDLAINQFIDGLPSNTLHLNQFKIDSGLSHLEPKREFEYYLDEIEKNRDNPQTKELLEKYGYDSRDTLEKIKDMMNQMEKMDNEAQGKPQPEEGQGAGDKWLDKLKGQGKDLGDTHMTWDELEEHISDDVTMNSMKRLIDSAKSTSRGKVPGHLEDIIERLYKKPEVMWQRELRSDVRGSAKSFKKPTIMRRNRRLPGRNDLKGKLSDRLVNVTAAVDVSGSVDKVQLEWIFSELYNILKLHKYNLNILLCDTEVQMVYRDVNNPTKLPMAIRGGGGTSFQPIFEYIDEHAIETNVLVFFTDGYGERVIDYSPKQNYKTMFVITDKKGDLSVNFNDSSIRRYTVKELNYTKGV